MLVGLALGLSQENSKKPGRLTCYRYEELSLARRQKSLMWARRQPWSRSWGGERLCVSLDAWEKIREKNGERQVLGRFSVCCEHVLPFGVFMKHCQGFN